MDTVLRNEIAVMKKDLIEYLSTTLTLSDMCVKALKNNDTKMAVEAMEFVEDYHGLADKLVDDAMYILTQNPLAKDLRRVIAYQSISKLVEAVIHNLLKVSKFTLRADGKLSRTSINRVRSMNAIFSEALSFMISEIKKPSSIQRDLYKINDFYKDMKEQVKKVQKELYKSLSTKKEMDEIKERIFTFSVCESIKRNGEKIVQIAEYLMFINNGKNHTFTK